MDNAGWYARHEAGKEDVRRSAPQRGPDGHYEPVEQIPMPQPEPYRPNTIVPTSADQGGTPPPVPEKDSTRTYGRPSVDFTEFPRSSRSQLPHRAPSVSEYTAYSSTQQLAHMNAIERSKSLRVAQMDPYLQLMAGPLLRYDTVDEGVWRGAAMIVTVDSNSTYDPNPSLSYSWDPDRPLKHARKPSHQNQRGMSFDLGPHPSDPHSPYSANLNDDTRPEPNKVQKHSGGQEIWVYCGRSGTFTFWRFMMEIPLGPREMRIKYSVNNGQELEFYVPGRDQNMRWAAYSCNGFSAGVNSENFRGPGFQSGYDPVWTDLLTKHAEEPFHALVGGGDQLYCDAIVREPEMQEWVTTSKAEKKKNFPLSEEMSLAIDRFYFNHYCHSFRNGAFARANSSIPMLNMLDDHDLIDGFGSYPDDLMSSPVFGTIGSRGYFFFLLFQCFINIEVDGLNDKRHPFKSLVLGGEGEFVHFRSHSFVSYLGPEVYMLLLDCRGERKKDQVCSLQEYTAVLNRTYALPPSVKHLVILLGIPIAYPRMVFLENVLESKMNPLVALGRSGSLPSFVNKFNADAELLDDLNDHWTAKAHKRERNWFIEQMQNYARNKRTRVTFVAGDVHCAAVGVLKTLSKGKQKPEVVPELDFRYMLNVVTSAIVNTPPPNGVLTMVAALATKTHRTLHHMDTDESMIPVFERDTNGGAPKSKYIMGKRNWCSVRWDSSSGDLVFDLRVEKEKGHGETVGYIVRSPPPRWTN